MRMWRPLTAAALALAASAAAAAQTRVATSPAFTTATRGSAAVLHAPRVSTAYPVPGLGFDYTHHAAINRDIAIRAQIDPATQQRIAFERESRASAPGVIVPVLPVINNTVVVVVQQAPPAVVVQAPPPTVIVNNYYGAPPAAAPPGEGAPAAEPPDPGPPPRELEAIVFVRTDGTLLLAVGYAQRGDRIIYITPEGARRSLALAELDLEFTLRVNEERGTFLHISSI